MTLTSTAIVGGRVVPVEGEPVEGGTRIGLALSQRELAGWVGSSREAVNKALAQLEARGLVTRDHGAIVVRDRGGLRHRAS